MSRADRLERETHFAEPGELGRPPHARHRACFGRGTAHVLDGSADRDLGRHLADELAHALSYVSEDHRDEVLQPARFAEDVRAHVERVTEERLERLEQPARR